MDFSIGGNIFEHITVRRLHRFAVDGHLAYLVTFVGQKYKDAGSSLLHGLRDVGGYAAAGAAGRRDRILRVGSDPDGAQHRFAAGAGIRVPGVAAVAVLVHPMRKSVSFFRLGVFRDNECGLLVQLE